MRRPDRPAVADKIVVADRDVLLITAALGLVPFCEFSIRLFSTIRVLALALPSLWSRIAAAELLGSLANAPLMVSPLTVRLGKVSMMPWLLGIGAVACRITPGPVASMSVGWLITGKSFA